jgi:2-polyprenyl-3-methyl-5-hydroxy-6-metoxy-1,4-benzoquinol methylase
MGGMNPYREAFYSRQYEWHAYAGAEDVRARHEHRVALYAWYTKGWLDLPRDTPILDIGCGSGQFLYFLRAMGFTNAVGIDLDARQVEVGRSLGLDCRCVPVFDFLRDDATEFGVVSMLDILEHFTREELFPLLNTVVGRMKTGGRLIASVPNAESPEGLHSTYADITHEISFTPLSLSELFFCHGLKVTALRDPWPAPTSPLRACYRAVSTVARRVETFRLGLLGLGAPKYWSSVVWALAEKQPAAGSPLSSG